MSGLRYFVGIAVLAAVIAGCGGAADTKDSGASSAASGGSGSKAKLSLVAYSTPQVVYDEVIPAFAKTSAGQGVSFTQSYGASGDQSRAVAAGQPADVVAFSLAPDVDKLVKTGLVADDWADTPTKGFVSNSVVVLMVRKGNPKHIKTWADLLKPGVEVLTPNPFTSGGAKWNLMGAYGAQLKLGKSPAQATDYVRRLLTEHVKVQDKSGRESVQNFLGGNGDVCISYENEAITAQQKGSDVDYVIPDQTLLIQNPIAVTAKAKPQAKAFVDYALSKPAQELFAKHGYRPVIDGVTPAFPTPKQLFTIDDLGGWTKVNDEFFDPDKGTFAKIESEAGVSTDK
ncbi:sulfate ABC transporter substrate-binding protein [Candidatus Solirubrobacter pratensis]|uniref:sulfate ABC transporter substrate-binding protein n=1 Tax=Candidatus Solirubrobacter pratensis TaxID=1298857 RepID=UPI000422155D